jgi:hypothetical protein
MDTEELGWSVLEGQKTGRARGLLRPGTLMYTTMVRVKNTLCSIVTGPSDGTE